jgi:hypothetical protein
MHAAQGPYAREGRAGQEGGHAAHGRKTGTVCRAACTALLLLAALVLPVHPAMALDDIANLKGMGVVAAGQVKRLDCPMSGRFDCNSWPTNFLKFEYENICFATDPGVCGAYCKGILATDKGKTVYFFESLPGGDLAQRRARGYECPPGF